MLKRICAFCLILVLTASLVTVLPVSAASKSDIQLVADLGIIDISENTGLIPKGYSRGDFARSLCLMERNNYPYPVSAEKIAEYATDIANNVNCDYIITAIVAGYMKTDSDGKFNPGKSVSLKDVVVALVKLLGYEAMAQANGGDYEDYYAIALKTKILNGVTIENSEKLSAAETAEILANTMSARLFAPHNVDYDEDCLWDRWRVHTNTGKILANSNMGILVERTKSNHVNIDGKIYYTKLLIENELVGSTVKYYVMQGDMGDEIVSIYVENYSDAVTLKSNEIESVKDNGAILTVKTDKKETLKVDKRGFLVVNGKTMSPSIAMFNAFESGTATFVDSDNNGSYDVVHMSLLFQTIIEGVNVSTNTLKTRFDSQVINLENIDNYEVYIGKKNAEFSSLSPGMPVGIACDSFVVKDGKLVLNFADATYVRLYASNQTSTGYITAIVDDKKFEIEDTAKNIGIGYTRLLKEGYLQPLKLGEYVKAYFDNMGALTYFEIVEGSGLRYGYLIKSGVNGNLNKTTDIKIMDSDGTFNVYSSGKKIILDGKMVDAGKVVYSVNDTNDVDLTKRQLIRYRVQDGILKEIDTKVIRLTYENAESSLDESYPFDVTVNGQSGKYVRSGAIEREFAFTSNCIVFIDEADTNDTDPSEDSFIVQKASSLGNSSYFIAGYDSNSDNELACVVRYDGYGSNSGASRSGLDQSVCNCYIVEKVKNTLDKDGNWGWTLTLAGDNKKVTHFVSETNLKLYVSRSATDWNKDKIDVYQEDVSDFTSVIEKGDIIRFLTNTAGNITYIERMFDFSSHKDGIAENDVKSGQSYVFANLEKISGDNFLYRFDTSKRYISKRQSIHTIVPLYHVSTGEVEMLPFAEIPSAATGNEVKCFIRYYWYGQVKDHIFYLYD